MVILSYEAGNEQNETAAADLRREVNKAGMRYPVIHRRMPWLSAEDRFDPVGSAS
jgi:hypothetical protein